MYERLYRNLYNPNMYYKVLENINIDFNKEEINEIIYNLIEEIKNESYKPFNNKQCKDQYLKNILVQEIIKLILNCVFYIKKKNVHNHLFEIRKWKEVNWFITCNVKASFENLNHKVLISILEEKIQDDKFIRLIRKYLKYQNINKEPIASVMFNIFLYKLDKLILLNEYEYDGLNTIHKTYIKYIRFNNDFLIGVWGNKNYALNIEEEINNIIFYLFENYNVNLKLSSSINGTNFLNYNVKKIYYNNLNNIKLFIPENFIKEYAIKEKLIKNINSNKWIYIAKYNKIHLTDQEIFIRFKKQKDNLYKYYYLAENLYEVMRKINYMLKISCFKTISHKHRTNYRDSIYKYRINFNDFGIEIINKKGEAKVITWNTPLNYKDFY